MIVSVFCLTAVMWLPQLNQLE